MQSSLKRDMKKLKEIHRIRLDVLTSSREATPAELLVLAKALNTGLIKDGSA